MKVLLNATIINIGGGLFVTVNFIKESLSSTLPKIEWHYLISNVVYTELIKSSIQLPEKKYTVINQSPAKVFRRNKTLRKIKEIEAKFKPDITYSIGSPSYVKFRSLEVQRLTNPYITHPNIHAINSYNFIGKCKILFKSYIQRIIISRGRYFVTQSKTAKNGILKLTNGSESDIAVIPNSLSEDFKRVVHFNDTLDVNYIFCLAAPYPHKNVHKIPYLARILLDKGLNNFKFVVTIPHSDPFLNYFNNRCDFFGVKDWVLNVGKINQLECRDWYLKSKIVFLPTYLETFSATILEALYLKVPIVTTNFSFNRDISEDYALYFEPDNWDQAANYIIKLIDNEKEITSIQMTNMEFVNRFKSFQENYTETVYFLMSAWKNEYKT